MATFNASCIARDWPQTVGSPFIRGLDADIPRISVITGSISTMDRMIGSDWLDQVSRAYARATNGVQGWFPLTDMRLFLHLDRIQSSLNVIGDILEIGVYEGKSAILLGYIVRRGERLVVSDTFGGSVPTAANAAENARYYPGLSQAYFEQNFARAHSFVPTIHAGISRGLPELEERASFRFVHIDGSHQYDDVRADTAFTKNVLGKNGVAVFDDYRTGYTPGVGAAVWEEVAEGLVPLCLTSQKFYGSWDSESKLSVPALIEAIGPDPVLQKYEIHTIRGRDVAWFYDDPSRSRAGRIVQSVTPPVLREIARGIRRHSHKSRYRNDPSVASLSVL